ncbi:hypothetical protein PCAR4_280032 [Paraburkholderia caribensis]|nr:hypothetical protein PCAR4_280032 [Paraburkholderia caribensis]
MDRSRLALESTWKIFILLSGNCDQSCRSCEDKEFACNAQRRGRARTDAGVFRRLAGKRRTPYVARHYALVAATRQSDRGEKRDSVLRGTNAVATLVDAVATQVSPLCRRAIAWARFA